MIFVQSFKHPGTIYALKWLSNDCGLNPDSRYLAIGGEPVDNIDTQLLIFNTAGTLDSVFDQSHGATVYAVDWCVINPQCPLLITGGKTAIVCNKPVNIRIYAVSCSGIMNLITSSYFEGGTVRSIATRCNGDNTCKIPSYILVAGDQVPDGTYATPNAILYYFNVRMQQLIPLAYVQQQEKVFATQWIPGYACTILALGSGCGLNELCTPNIGLYSLECNKVPQLVQTGEKNHDINITSLASCKIGNASYILAGSEPANWQPAQELDPLCALQLLGKEIALFKANFCVVNQQPCTPTPICDRNVSILKS